MKQVTDGEYGGLGLTVSTEEGAVKVVAPTDDTPAARAGHQVGRLHHPDQRRAAVRHDAERGGRQDARRAGHGGQDDRDPRRRAQAARVHAEARDHPDQAGQVGGQGRHRGHPHRLVQQADRPGDQGGDRRASRSSSGRSSPASSSTCARTPAACSTSRSRSATPSSTTARSSRSAAGPRTTSNAITPTAAT